MQSAEPADGRARAVSEAPSGYTVDAFHNGGFFLLQPAGSGHRAGMDAMLLAATVPQSARGMLVDLGAGAGAAGLAAAARLPDLQVVLIERSPVMAECARRSLELAENAHLAARARVIEADVALHGDRRRAAGLMDNSYDHVIMNPPFNSGRDRKTPDPLRSEAHAMETGDLFERWLRTAGAILKPGGQLSLIARPESMADILTAMGQRFGGAEITPVCPRPGDDAIRMLVTAIKGSRARLSLRDRILIHEGAGNGFSAEMNDFANGRAALSRRMKTRPSK
ncbi:MAG: methyltransferase [Hoeflea sp.]|uniref:tRNA1(Val) (adenine(37)-N6)-methyltransferase n=1 Tax=Hoeflea sp. TaxID=1940281 RepID=UPI002730BCC5|nr:methyltransferase [Hoeflea sp.]MDP2119788.1 methyltransferase [Hoeflea sp.]